MNAVSPSSPHQQIVDFYGRDFLVTEDVLIPRPETELLIDAVLNLVGKPYLPGVTPSPAKLPTTLTILDIGTGTGCIAITLKKELPSATVIATDISPAALKVAQQNADKLQADIGFIHSNLLASVTFKPDLIVANLPYVDITWDWLNLESLSHEPSIALYADDHGLALIKKLIDQVTPLHVKYLALEADPCQHSAIITYASRRGLDHVETRGFSLLFRSNAARHPSITTT